MTAGSSSTTLWYLTRGSGAVALLLLTASVVLGILTTLRVEGRAWPRFAVGSLHRNLTLLSIVFVALHVVTTVGDGYAPVGLKDAVVPFASPYRPVWLGLGTVAFDLLLALVLTSYLRARIGVRLWRGVHWLAYASWPVALVHALGTGSDPRSAWLVALGAVCLVAVAGATLGRAGLGGGAPAPRLGAAAAAVLVPIVVAGWYLGGPARPGWAARAGTPTKLLASRKTRVPRILTSAPVAPTSFHARAAGTIHESTGGRGARIVIRLALAGSPGGALRIDLRGTPAGDGVALSASGVSFVPATTRAVYYGSVTGLDGTLVTATVRDAAGDRLALTINLSLDAGTGKAVAVVDAVKPAGDGE
jgi:DMSO/TMAO reductase YedYZ heme-binding membrane subunit